MTGIRNALLPVAAATTLLLTGCVGPLQPIGPMGQDISNLATLTFSQSQAVPDFDDSEYLIQYPDEFEPFTDLLVEFDLDPGDFTPVEIADGCTGGLTTHLEMGFFGGGTREVDIDSCGLDDDTFEAQANAFFSEWRLAHAEATEPIVAVPADAVLVVTAAATASNGAVVDISVIVHSPNPFSADGAADAWAATTAWCVGELDDSVIADQGYSFTTVDVTATTREGDWPDDTPLLLAPLPYYDASIATGGDLVQTNQPSIPSQVAGSVPHCAQPALLLGPGSGQIYVGIPGDIDGDGSGTPPLGGWANRKYGVNTHVPGDDQAADVTFSECTVQITDLGASLGAPTASWQEAFQSDFCIVGGDSVGVDAG